MHSLNGPAKSHEMARIRIGEFFFFLWTPIESKERVNTGAKGPQVENGIKDSNTNDTRERERKRRSG